MQAYYSRMACRRPVPCSVTTKAGRYQKTKFANRYRGGRIWPWVIFALSFPTIVGVYVISCQLLLFICSALQWHLITSTTTTFQTTVWYLLNALICASHLPPFQEAISFHSLLFSPQISLNQYRKLNSTKSLHEIVSPRMYGPFLSVNAKYECTLANPFSNFPHSSVRALPVGTIASNFCPNAISLVRRKYSSLTGLSFKLVAGRMKDHTASRLRSKVASNAFWRPMVSFGKTEGVFG